MSLGGILILVVMVISLFVFIYLVVKTARGWGILHTLMLCLLFIECWTFLFFAANVLDRRLTSLREFTQTRNSLEKLQKDNHRAIWGGDNIAEQQEALVPLAGEVRRLTADRGRVWRGASKMNIEGEQIRLELAAATPEVPAVEDLAAAEPAPAAAPAPGEVPQIPLDMVVYGFSQSVDAENRPFPQFYLGEFKVVESEAGQVLLRPTTPLEPNQIKAVNEESTWSLYEMLPQDSHETFAVENSEPSPEAVFGQMDEAKITELLSGIPETDGRREKVLNEYLRDGQPAQESDPPRSVWYQVEVVKPFDLDVDSDEQANATIGGYFDASGRTVDVRIKRGEEKKVTLPEGTQFLLPQGRAEDSINRGEVKLIQRVFVRPLNSYETGFEHLRIRRDEVARAIDVTKRDTAVLQEADQLGVAMTSARQVEAQKLTADRDQYRHELSILDNEIKSITDKLEQTRNHLIELYKSLHATHDSMVKSQ
jgi:hypothetical protein